MVEIQLFGVKGFVRTIREQAVVPPRIRNLDKQSDE